MNSNKWIFLFCLLFVTNFLQAQTTANKLNGFFTDDQTLEVKLTTDIKKLSAEKKSMKPVEALFTCKFADSSIAEEPIQLKQRGKFRRENCYLASLMLEFSKDSGMLSPLKRLKLVGGCGKNKDDEQFLFKEYLTYKIYNLLTGYSLRVRMMHVSYVDIKEKIKPYTQYAFVIEDIDDMAKRNKCREKQHIKFSPKSTHTNQTILVSLFQYMIGNTDWSIPFYHNIKLLVPRKDSNALPLPVAYDFDVSGLVNPPYAAPPPNLGIENVTQRLYRGYPNTMEELQPVIDVYLQKEKEIYAVINNFQLLSQRNKKEMTEYLEEFFKIIKDKAEVKSIFITNARTN